MSQADDDSLLAMAAARMSSASIAMTMGWSEARVYNRLAKLKATPAGPPEAKLTATDDPAPRTIEPRIPDVAVSLPPPVRPPAPWIGFARRFRAAGWSLAEVGWLFDRDLDELAEALR